MMSMGNLSRLIESDLTEAGRMRGRFAGMIRTALRRLIVMKKRMDYWQYSCDGWMLQELAINSGTGQGALIKVAWVSPN